MYLIQKRVSNGFQNPLNICKLKKRAIFRVQLKKIIIFFFRKVDLFIGALDESPAIRHHLIASRPYYHDHLTWCVQKAKPIPLWKNIFHLCRNWEVYMGLLIAVMTLLPFFYYLFQYEHPIQTWNETLLMIFRVAIGISANIEPKSNPFRITYAFGLLAGTIFSIVLNAIIMRNVTTPILRPQIQTIEEITNGDFKLMGDRFALAKLKLQTNVKCSSVTFFNRMFTYLNGSNLFFRHIHQNCSVNL